MKLYIKRVDMSGYCGREHHPEPSDVGLVVTPLRMETYHLDPEDGSMPPLVDERGEVPSVERAKDKENHETAWVVVTDDGRTLDLMGHEVSIIIEGSEGIKLHGEEA